MILEIPGIEIVLKYSMVFALIFNHFVFLVDTFE